MHNIAYDTRSPCIHITCAKDRRRARQNRQAPKRINADVIYTGEIAHGHYAQRNYTRITYEMYYEPSKGM